MLFGILHFKETNIVASVKRRTKIQVVALRLTLYLWNKVEYRRFWRIGRNISSVYMVMKFEYGNLRIIANIEMN